MSCPAFDRMPHRGGMLLLHAITAVEADRITCDAKPTEALLCALGVDGQLTGVALVELGAQAAAAHASLHGVGRAHSGLLLALRQVELAVTDASDLGPFTVTAHRIAADAGGAHYQFQVLDGPRQILQGEAILSMQAESR